MYCFSSYCLHFFSEIQRLLLFIYLTKVYSALIMVSANFLKDLLISLWGLPQRLFCFFFLLLVTALSVKLFEANWIYLSKRNKQMNCLHRGVLNYALQRVIQTLSFLVSVSTNIRLKLSTSFSLMCSCKHHSRERARTHTHHYHHHKQHHHWTTLG